MKRCKLYRILTVAILLSLLLVVITPGTPVLAATILSVSPASGAVGTKVTVTGENFDSYKGDDIYLFFGNQQVTTKPITVPETGSFSFDFNTPSGAEPGRHQITAKNELGWTLALSSFTVLKAGISLDRKSGVVGTKLTINGQGFYAGRAVNVYYDNRMLGTEAAGGTGEFIYSFTIPDSTAGKHKIVAKNAEGHSVEAEFEVLPSITLNTTSAAAGDILTVNGSGFGPKSSIDVYFEDDEVAYAKTDEFGSFEVIVKVPAMKSSTYEVKVADEGNNTAKTRLTIVEANLNQTTGNVGTLLIVSGGGFIAEGTITVKYDDVEVAQTTASSGRTFSVAFNVPVSVSGEHVIAVRDGVNTQKLIFTMESQAPPTPAPQSPETGVKAEQPVHFDWAEVTDDSPPVTYVLQIGTSKDFTDDSIVWEKAGLTASEYTLTEAEKLAPVSQKEPYYWRVEAVDGASNESLWSTPRSFYVGTPFNLPGWALFTLIGVGALVIGFLAFWLRRRAAYYQT